MAIARRFDTIMGLKKGVYNVMLLGFAFAWLSCVVVDGASRRHVFEVGSRGRLPDHKTIRTVLEVATSKGKIRPLNETEAAQVNQTYLKLYTSTFELMSIWHV